jgi:hypothetical protein
MSFVALSRKAPFHVEGFAAKIRSCSSTQALAEYGAWYGFGGSSCPARQYQRMDLGLYFKLVLPSWAAEGTEGEHVSSMSFKRDWKGWNGNMLGV